jgi:hypothetical protein
MGSDAIIVAIIIIILVISATIDPVFLQMIFAVGHSTKSLFELGTEATELCILLCFG